MLAKLPETNITNLRKVLVIVGTTGVGKTKLSIEIAKAINGEIINADAMQMYRGLDIATAKITEKEKEGVPHHLFDIIVPKEAIDVKHYKQQALKVIDQILSRNKVPIIVGGTMYYTQSILWNSQLLDEEGVPGTKDQAGLDALSSMSAKQMFEKLQELDPVMASRLHINNTRRVRRGLEVFYKTGRRQSDLLHEQHKDRKTTQRLFDSCALMLHCQHETLLDRLEKRVDNMMQSGLIEELKSLRAQVKTLDGEVNKNLENGPSTGILQAIGYKEFESYLRASEAGSYSKYELTTEMTKCVQLLNIATRQYARRQLAWIRNKFINRNIPVYSLDTTNLDQWHENVATPAIQIAENFLKGGTMTQFRTIQEIRHLDPLDQQSSEDKWVENVCEVCGSRRFFGVVQWQEHLKSKKHRANLKISR
uniref:tRNA isopentenyltransferase putative n=1 Tax=Albugo laibachii Nc14 TaxID=890382 RepID=F0WHK4_9STRA|nr:tRNA isopentenyltransferase putative [Albugo laibachii Nc14]|eukprot:CCA20742.1 tRNA isopentenyltransferase putative [Albugo laibachii Nc14]